MEQQSQEMLPLVDLQGNVIGSATRAHCHGGSYVLHPVVHLHVFNPQGELYLQQRPLWKDIQPGKWDTAVGGHVDFGENFLQALLREVEEEVGLKPDDYVPEYVISYDFRSDTEYELVNVYKTITDVEPKPTDELDGGRFFPRQEILQRMGTGFFTPNFEQEWKRLFM